MTNNVLHMINLKLSSKRYLRRNRQSASQSRQMRRNRQSASQSTNASQTSKCVAIDTSTQNAYNFLPACVAIDKCKRQSASQSTNASQTSKCVASRQMRRKRQSASQSTIVE
jgi:hypothetical protein